jgi:hypothetical protein
VAKNSGILFPNAGSNVYVSIVPDLRTMLRYGVGLHGHHIMLLGDLDPEPTSKEWASLLGISDQVFLHGKQIRKFAGTDSRVVYVEGVKNIQAEVTMYYLPLGIFTEPIFILVHEDLAELMQD